ncbi:hypothetical protein AVEN_77287-1 [Araneus ventricosus]|uniref:Uncharacterized protein n=1 Tax=Araneus ventricosus TaxID=182803 RepID=A0A4Y2W8G1_ARAVE|nr:hypothetical protein AVEN_77287-1 [Araneus ventricosus]
MFRSRFSGNKQTATFYPAAGLNRTYTEYKFRHTQLEKKNPKLTFFLKEDLNADSVKMSQAKGVWGLGSCGISNLQFSTHCVDRYPTQLINQNDKPRKGKEIRKNTFIAL